MNEQPADALARALGITAADAATTEIPMKNELPETGSGTDTETAAAPAAEKETTMKSAAKKAAKPEKKAKPVKKPAEAKADKAPKPKKERVPKEDKPGRTFAIRITDAELEAIHKAAGPRNATRFIRSVAAAFAAEDSAAFTALVKEARVARS